MMESKEFSIINKIKDLNNEKNNLSHQVSDLEVDRDRELKIAQENIVQKYAKMRDDVQEKIDTKNNELADLLESIARASWFDADFAKVLADLMTTFEGRGYEFQDTQFSDHEYTVLAMDKMSSDVLKYVQVIVRSDEKQKSYHDDGIDSLNNLMANGQIILLNKKNSFGSKDFSFYDVDMDNLTLVSKINLEHFDYLQEFINRVIDWKLIHKVKTIPGDELRKIEVEFLRDNSNVIALNFNARANEDQEVLAKRREMRKAKLNDMLK